MEAAKHMTLSLLQVSAKEEKTPIHSLPYELMLKIFEDLDLKSIAHSIKTCKTWKQIVERNPLFKSLFFKLLPDSAKNLKGDTEEAFFLRNLIWEAR